MKDIRHIADTRYDNIGLSLCGETIGTRVDAPSAEDETRGLRTLKISVDCFVDIDHWFNSLHNGRRDPCCTECLYQIEKAACS